MAMGEPHTLLNSVGVKYTLASPAARAAAINNEATAKAAVNFNGKADIITSQTDNMAQGAQGYALTEVLRFWVGFSTSCGTFNQFAICKDSTKLWNTSIYAREQAVISANPLSDLCTNNSVSVSPMESIIGGKRHCGQIDRKLIYFVDQYVVSAPYDLYHSLTFENADTDDQKYFYGYNAVKCYIVIAPENLGVKSSSTVPIMTGTLVELPYNVRRRCALIKTMPLLCKTNEHQLNPITQSPT
ncbi:MAG: hypothetical protein EZS28_021650 [Streblomastix strix]|uniref:Uncharacterized protein n=1 Tax=Streblomastix strix TaxID=222440 RepID=A0A5J4VJN2_9EUKA|nr:MAG: hypothetical protein EZS28_021650 [Streblomastix strix]